MSTSRDSFKTRDTLQVNHDTITTFRLGALEEHGHAPIARLPFSIRILLENLLRCEDGVSVNKDHIEAVATWDPKAKPSEEIAFRPARVLLQDFTGVPAVVDLAAMRDAYVAMGGKPEVLDPVQPVDLVIDHSVQVDHYASAEAFTKNVEIEVQRNKERYEFLKWGQQAFDRLRVVPPGTGIVHQVNLEYLAKVVFAVDDGEGKVAYPDTVVGTDSHTPMVNGLGVLGWGVGGIEAEAAMLGQPLSMLVPQVIGFRLTGKTKEGVTATDVVLTITEILRQHGVVGKFVEFCGPGLDSMPLPDRATISNMAPEYGATVGFFPVDEETLRYLRFTGRDEKQVELVEAYCRAQGLFRDSSDPEPTFTEVLELDLGDVTASLAGPRRPQDRIALRDAKKEWGKALATFKSEAHDGGDGAVSEVSVKLNGQDVKLKDGSVAIAAITSCTNTSNPAVMVAAGLLARHAVERGLRCKPYVKTSLAPGSQVVTDYLDRSGLTEPLEKLGFHLVGYGCTTCIGNSGPLDDAIAAEADNVVLGAVLSGNRNFEGRINASVRANYLASPPLVVAYALAGTMDIDFESEPVGEGKDGKPVYLKDIWPSNHEVQQTIEQALQSTMFQSRYAEVFKGDAVWQDITSASGAMYRWKDQSTYIRKPTFFADMEQGHVKYGPEPLKGGRVLAMVGDSVTTDHISPAGSIAINSPAARYLREHGVKDRDFNSYGSRRGNHEVMVRGTFANIRLRNLLVPGVQGGVSRHLPSNESMSIFDTAMRYKDEGVPLLVLAGREYGSGSSRDWAAKGPMLLGVRAVIAESYERIHRSNLIGMGILPLEYRPGQNAETLGLCGEEIYDIEGIRKDLKVGQTLQVRAGDKAFDAIVRLDTPQEVQYFNHGGILRYVLHQFISKLKQ